MNTVEKCDVPARDQGKAARRGAILAIPLLLAACGGGSVSVEPPVEPPPEPTIAVAPATWSAAELAYARASTPALSFYDLSENGSQRVTRKDLQGTLEAEVQFVQSHSSAPEGNDARELPTPVALRSALALLIAEGAPAAADPAVDAMMMTASRNGEVLGSLRMRPPALLPRSDSKTGGSDGRGDVSYSSRAWSALIPWSWMRPGLKLEFAYSPASGPSLRGTLAEGRISFAPPTELVIQNIRLGMLTTPNTDRGYLMKNPAAAGTDYFQTVPISRLTVASYEDLTLDRVIVATGGGAVYTTGSPSPQTGGVYDGDMRQNVAKEQIAQGVNLANFGIVDSPMNEEQPEYFNQRVVHHARGLYANGVQEHGLSGGNGMITLLESTGNEFSHELGHSYSLGHYPGAEYSAKNPVHHADSGWGFIQHRSRMRTNLVTDLPFQSAGTVDYRGNFAGKFNYNADSMSGGEPRSAFSNVTHYTGYSARRIQSYLNTARTGGPRAFPDTAYPSGWRSWNVVEGRWEDRAAASPGFSAPKPALAGVPVVTLAGGYQTSRTELNVIYPRLAGNWGVVYNELPPPPASGSACWLEADFADGSRRRVALSSTGAGDAPRKFHVNLDAAKSPRQAAIKCRSAAGAETVLATRALEPASTPEPAVVIGQEDGSSALEKLEVRQLDLLLSAKAPDTALKFDDQEKLIAWRDRLGSISARALSWVDGWLLSRDKAMKLNTYALEHPGLSALPSPRPAPADLITLAAEAGVAGSDGVMRQPASGLLALGEGRCVALVNASAGTPELALTPGCSSLPVEHWWFDGTGRVHNSARPDLCLSTDGGWYSPITAVQCHPMAVGQRFVQRASGRLESTSYDNRSIEGLLITNNEEGSSKAWRQLPVDDSTVWPLLDAQTMLVLSRQLQ